MIYTEGGAERRGPRAAGVRARAASPAGVARVAGVAGGVRAASVAGRSTRAAEVGHGRAVEDRDAEGRGRRAAGGAQGRGRRCVGARARARDREGLPRRSKVGQGRGRAASERRRGVGDEGGAGKELWPLEAWPGALSKHFAVCPRSSTRQRIFLFF